MNAAMSAMQNKPYRCFCPLINSLMNTFASWLVTMPILCSTYLLTSFIVLLWCSVVSPSRGIRFDRIFFTVKQFLPRLLLRLLRLHSFDSTAIAVSRFSVLKVVISSWLLKGMYPCLSLSPAGVLIASPAKGLASTSPRCTPILSRFFKQINCACWLRGDSPLLCSSQLT